jgi:uncharacterized membrane protein YdjX (TVP38/TMEM64 family)
MSSRTIVRVLAAVALFAILAALSTLPLERWLTDATAWAGERPVAGSLLYLVAATLAGLLMTPGWIPMMLAGLLFGVAKGFAIGIVGIVCGATAAFLAGRNLMREWVADRIASNDSFVAIDRAVDQQGFTVVLLTRLAFVLPFNLLNYAYGATRVGLGTYMAATGIGMLPIVGVYVYLGTLARDVGQLLDGGAPDAGLGWLTALALIALGVAIFVIRRTALRVLAEQVDDEAAEGRKE